MEILCLFVFQKNLKKKGIHRNILIWKEDAILLAYMPLSLHNFYILLKCLISFKMSPGLHSAEPPIIRDVLFRSDFRYVFVFNTQEIKIFSFML